MDWKKLSFLVADSLNQDWIISNVAILRQIKSRDEGLFRMMGQTTNGTPTQYVAVIGDIAMKYKNYIRTIAFDECCSLKEAASKNTEKFVELF